MHTFLTPDPVTLEIRNAAGPVRVTLTDTTTTTVVVTPDTSHPLGFLDDAFKAFGGGRGFGRGRTVARLESFASSFRMPGLDAPGDSGPSTFDDLAAAVRVEHRDGAEPVVEIDTDQARDGWRSSFTIEITAPVGSSVRLKSQSSDLTVTGAAGVVDARTAAGDVALEAVAGRAHIQTASGDITLRAAGAGVDLRTASGAVQAGSVAGDAVVRTTSGDIQLGAVGGNVSAQSVSGDVQVSDATAGEANLQAVSGDVRVGIHPGSLAAVNLTTISGRTDTDFEVTGELPEGDSPVLQVTVKTTSGNIVLHRVA